MSRFFLIQTFRRLNKWINIISISVSLRFDVKHLNYSSVKSNMCFILHALLKFQLPIHHNLKENNLKGK